MASTKSPRMVKLTALVTPEVAEVYRRAALAGDKSVSQVIREALEDRMTATRAEMEVTADLEAGHAHAAIMAYYNLAKTMMDEATRAMTEATLLDMDMLGVVVDKMLERMAAEYQAATGKPLPSQQRRAAEPYTWRISDPPLEGE